MKQLLPCLFALLLLSCTAPRYYSYTFRMMSPQQKDDLVLEDSLLRMRLQPARDMILFRIDNKTDQAIKLPWDDISMAVNGNSKRVIHKETGTFSAHQIQPPTTITPHGYILDALIPTENLNFFTERGRTTVSYAVLFPDYDFGKKSRKSAAEKWRNANITLYFPLIRDNKQLNYTIDLKVVDVKASKDKPKKQASILSGK